MNQAEYCNIINRLNELQKIIYQTIYQYKQPLSGLEVTIQQRVHKLTIIRGFYVLDSAGNQAFLNIRILSDLSIQITSNVDMTNLTLYLC